VALLNIIVSFQNFPPSVAPDHPDCPGRAFGFVLNFCPPLLSPEGGRSSPRRENSIPPPGFENKKGTKPRYATCALIKSRRTSSSHFFSIWKNQKFTRNSRRTNPLGEIQKGEALCLFKEMACEDKSLDLKGDTSVHQTGFSELLSITPLTMIDRLQILNIAQSP